MKYLFLIVIEILVSSSLARAMCLSIDEGRTRGCARNLRESCPGDTYAFHDNSCLSSNTRNELISEVLNMKNGETLRPELFKKYKPEQIARSMIYRYYSNAELANVSDQDVRSPSYDFYGDTQIQISFKLGVAELIAKNGFLNQHQTQTTGGCACLESRAEVEDHLTALKIEANYQPAGQLDLTSGPNLLRPKYTYVAATEPLPVNISPLYSEMYGNVIAVLDDSLKKRMTFTNGDSLNTNTSDTRRVHTMSYLASQLDFSTLGENGYYLEGQIWGPVKGADINYILVNCPKLGGIGKDGVERLAKAFPQSAIYSCEADTGAGVHPYKAVRFLKGPMRAGSPGIVNVVTATLNGVDVLKSLRATCDQRTYCNLPVQNLYPSGKTSADTDTLSVRYICEFSDVANEHKVSIPRLANKATLSFDCGDEKKPTYSVPRVIKIKSATFGGNISGVKEGNVTTKAAGFCDGKPNCDYKVSVKFLGDPAPKQKKSFKLTYVCDPQLQNSDIKSIFLSADEAEDTVTRLKCD